MHNDYMGINLRSCYLTPSTPAMPASNIKGAADGGGVIAGVVSYSNNHKGHAARVPSSY